MRTEIILSNSPDHRSLELETGMGKRWSHEKPGDEAAGLQTLCKEEPKRTRVGFPETGK